jgi:hypothetical protein
MNKQWLAVILVVISLTMLVYWNALGGEFVLDGRAFLVNNPQLGSPHTLAYFFTENLWHYSNLPDAYSASYRPIYFLTLWLSNQLSMASPLALHLLALQLHMLAVLLLLFMIRQLIPEISPLAAGIGASLFAVHPVHVEAVAWVSAFIHPLATIFLLLAYLAHNHTRQSGGIITTVMATLFFILALLSNETAVAFPIFILLNDRIRYGSMHFLKNLPYFVLLVMYMLVRKEVLGAAIPLTFSDPQMWLRLPVFLLEYLRHLLIPWPQPLYLQMPETWGLSISAIVTTMLFAALISLIRKVPFENRRVPVVALLWIVVFLLPPMIAAFSPDARFALRSLYLPSIGISVLLAWAINAVPKFRQPVSLTLLSVVFLLAIVGTISANRNWSDDGQVYGRIIYFNPDHHAGYLGLGRFMERRGETDLALIRYEQATSRAKRAETTDPLEYLARLLGKSGDNDRSLVLFKQLTEFNPDNASAWNGIGNNLWALGQPGEAAKAYQRAHEAEPNDWIACSNLVLILNQMGRSNEAKLYTGCAQETPGDAK